MGKIQVHLSFGDHYTADRDKKSFSPVVALNLQRPVCISFMLYEAVF